MGHVCQVKAAAVTAQTQVEAQRWVMQTQLKCEHFESKTVISPNTQADTGVLRIDLRMFTAGSVFICGGLGSTT
jgi:heme-binding NEAT domain protein